MGANRCAAQCHPVGHKNGLLCLGSKSATGQHSDSRAASISVSIEVSKKEKMYSWNEHSLFLNQMR